MRLMIIGNLAGQMGEACKIAVSRGAKVVQADAIDSGLDLLRSTEGAGADLVLVDVAIDIATLISCMQAEHMSAPVVACGTADDTTGAVNAIKAGAKEYIPLPPDPELIAAVFAAVSQDDHRLVFGDPVMRQTLALAERVARSSASILITGESGTGKELLARYIHRRSQRADKPFVSVNCAAIPENLLESELFGHEKGAFTGAVARRIGKFEAANGGTLLLDELGEMDLRLQAKLLRVIQEREIDRVGGSKPVKVDLRILATTNRRLETEVSEGRFREDLYFRVNVVNIRIPALRERPKDIELLAEHFVRKYSEMNDIDERTLSNGGRELLLNYKWPGNVRELENTMHRAVLLAAGDHIGAEAIALENQATVATNMTNTTAENLSHPIAVNDAGNLVGRTVADVEKDLIIDTLSHCLGNRTHAATILGISIRTLRNKLRQYTAEGTHIPAPGGESGGNAVL